MKRIVAAAAASLLLLSSCSGDSPSEEARGSSTFVSTWISDVPSDELVAVTDRAYAMGLQLGKNPSGNSVASPLSLLLALSMLGEGATGEAANQIDKAWGVSGDDRSRLTAALITSLGAYDEGLADFDGKGSPPERPLLHIANRMVADDEFEPSSAFLERLATYHDAPLGRVDLASTKASDFLDAWVNEHTAGLIPTSAIQPKPELRLVFQNAVLFAASWEEPFSKESVFDDTFSLADGRNIQVPAIHASRSVRYARSGDWQAIQLDYTDGFTAEIVLPPEGTDPASLPADQLAQLMKDLRGREVELIIMFPTLDIQTKNDLLDDIQELGMGALLIPDAKPLTGIANTDDPLYLNQAIQQATLRVDADGTVASAVTEFGVETLAAPGETPQAFLVDRPYLFLVHHEESGIPVFLAAVRNPIEE